MARTNSQKARVVVVDDHDLIRQSIYWLLQGRQDMELCGQANDTRAAMNLIQQQQPDVVLVDLMLEHSDGFQLLREMRDRRTESLALVVSGHDESAHVRRALQLGARGFVSKTEVSERVIEAIQHVLGGGIYLSKALAIRLGWSDDDVWLTSVLGDETALSAREFDVLERLGRGLGPSAIADDLRVSVKTIESYQEHLKIKLGITSSAELRHYAITWLHDR